MNKAVYTSRSRVRVGRSGEKAKCFQRTDRPTDRVGQSRVHATKNCMFWIFLRRRRMNVNIVKSESKLFEIVLLKQNVMYLDYQMYRPYFRASPRAQGPHFGCRAHCFCLQQARLACSHLAVYFAVNIYIPNYFDQLLESWNRIKLKL